MFRAYDIRTPSADADAGAGGAAGAGRGLLHSRRPGGPRGRRGARRAADRPAVPDHHHRARSARRGWRSSIFPGPARPLTSTMRRCGIPRHAAVIVGASHNPSGDTGQKILGPGVQPIAQGIGPEGGLDRIKEHYLPMRLPTSGARRGSLRTEGADRGLRESQPGAGRSEPGGLEGRADLPGLPLRRGGAGDDAGLRSGRGRARAPAFHGRRHISPGRPQSGQAGRDPHWPRGDAVGALRGRHVLRRRRRPASISTGAMARICRRASSTPRSCRRSAGGFPARAWASLPTSSRIPWRSSRWPGRA